MTDRQTMDGLAIVERGGNEEGKKEGIGLLLVVAGCFIDGDGDIPRGKKEDVGILNGVGYEWKS